ncbi:DUF1049 domain-containing protein [Brachybacterium endophyticum]|uniref:DUF1049 domain-containing protein n=1 Tax=Brachybacterium endophyticum TaxID=2182385 RepID=A0A2U2RP48_9MICO|nr:LapA family protein [Brachybacterium endophyticum]PWH07653.1 DUF1049 domain-containing protein [Brachybacterium endophyticum]
MTSSDDSTPTTPREPRRTAGEPLAEGTPAAEGARDIRDTGARPDAEPAPSTAPSSTSPSGTSSAETRPSGRRDETERHAPAHDDVQDVPRSGGRTAGVWIALVLGAIVLILLLVFILQNNTPADFHYFAGQFALPLGIAMLLAAIAGALVMALVGSVRMFQQGRTIKKLRKQLQKVQHPVDR